MKKKIPTLVILIIMLLSLAIPKAIFAESAEATAIDDEFTLLDDGTGTKIPAGATVIHYNTGITEVRDSQNKLLMRVKDSDSKQMQLPKETVSASSVYEIPDGSNINLEDDGSITVSKDGIHLLTVADYKRMKEADFLKKYGGTYKIAGFDLLSVGKNLVKSIIKPPLTKEITNQPGYLDAYFGPHVEAAVDSDVDYLGNFSAYWDVPSSPTSPYADTCIYIWNGVEDAAQTDVLQPVLKYTQAGGWDCLAYYGVDGSYFHSTAIDASVYDDIKGVINHGPIQWAVAIFNETTGLGRSITVTGVSNLSLNAWLYCLLEAYGVWYNTQMPGDTLFHNMSVKDNNSQTIDVNWYSDVNAGWAANLSGLSVSVISDAMVSVSTAN